MPLLRGDSSPSAVTVGGETIHSSAIQLRMYEAQGFGPVWSDNAVAGLAQAITSLEEDGLTPADYRFPAIEAQLRSPDLAGLTRAQRAEAEVLLNEAFLRALANLFYGKADPQRLDPNINFTRRYDGADPAPALARFIQEGRFAAALDWARPGIDYHAWLRDGLARYRAYQAAGGWRPIPGGETLKAGMRDPRVALLRERLTMTGDLEASTPDAADPTNFDDKLKNAVQRFQARHGIERDGAVGKATLAAMNVPVEARIYQIRVNLERQRWLMHEIYGEFLMADIAGFELTWVKDGDVVWREDIQVGTEYTQTPVFKGVMRYLEFNPTWTIPPGILERSILPALKKDPAYLDKKGYLLLTQQQEPVDPSSVDWKNLEGFPYIVRQPAGPDNALGQVKFLFPNPHFVFLHDTNHRELFARTERTFSSGCVRVRNPFDLAERLLAGQPGWERTRIDQIVASGETVRTELKKPMRILIAYNTARVRSAGGPVQFRADIYQRDAKVLAALDGPFTLRR